MTHPSHEAEVARLWDENAELWTQQVRAGQDRFREVCNNPMFFAFVPDLARLEVLDAGCGEGHNTRLFARRGARMTGIDLSPRLIKAAKEQEAKEPLGIKYGLSSYSDLAPFGDECFDAVISTMALMDGPDFKGAAHEFHRVLKKGGGLYFSVTHPCFMTRDSRWITDENGNETGRLVGNYWDEPFIERWGFTAGLDQKQDVFTIRYFPHTLSDYINGLCEAGFRVSKILEPRPTEAMVAAYPRIGPHRRHVPHSLFIAAVKQSQ